MPIEESNRKIETDKRFSSDEQDGVYESYTFIRLSAKGRTFRHVSFRYSTFESCYLRDAKFDSCDFTGCRFLSTNLHGARFSGCKFDYATFERTFIDPSIFDTECPPRENLRVRFARTLRMNYHQLGDAAGVNRAMKEELKATGIHLYKACFSKEDYYRKKYHGVLWYDSVKTLILFNIGDFVWGNGESAIKLLRTVAVVLGIMTIYDVLNFSDPKISINYWESFLRSSEIFIGLKPPDDYPKPYLTIITIIRLISVGFLLSIIIKKFNRR